MKNLNILSPFILGFFCLGFQIIIVREFSAVFWGNELNFGIVLGFWFFWEGIGALIGGRIRFSKPLIYKLYLLVLFLFSISLIFIRLNRFFSQTLPGEIPPLYWILFVSTLSTSLSLILGILFVLNVELMDGKLSFVYILDSLGSAFSSIFVYFLIVPNMSNWMGATLIGIIGIFLLMGVYKPKNLLIPLSIGLVIFFLIFGFYLENQLSKRYWFPLHLLFSKDSKFGKISVVEENGEISVYENGMISFSSHEKEGAEESIHFPLLVAKKHEEILLVGGGFGGALREALKYGDIKIDYLELDPEIIKITKKLEVFKDYFEDERIRLHIGDARNFLQRIDKKWDCIIMILPEPINAQINRLYTKEFYHVIKEKLKEGGIFSFKVQSSGEYINSELQKVISIQYRTLREVFPYINYIPGDRCVFLASNRPISVEKDSINGKKEGFGIETSFINEKYLTMRMSPLRYLLLESAFEIESKANSDFLPSLYLFQLNYLSGYHGKAERDFYNFLVLVPRFWLIEFPIAIFILFLILRFFLKRSPFYMLPVFGIGLTTLSMEILIIFSYQIFFGYFYGRIAILLSSFMAGLTIGSFLSKTFLRPSIRKLSVLQFLIFFLSIGVFLFFQLPSTLITTPTSHFIFYLFLFLYGAISGSIFIISNELFIKEEKRFGVGWAIDLGGSTIGALSISTIFLPVLGFPVIIKILLIFNLLIWLFVVLRK
ncbi:MAG: hypothetical protein ACUVUG_00020 [Candidatus Aminicenantia bacterium]